MSEPRPKSRRVWQFAAASAGVVVILLLLFEATLALFFPVAFRRPVDVPDHVWTQVVHRRSEVPGLRFELVPGARADLRGAPISVNSLGFRGPEVSREKPPGTIRIVAMGASVAFGWTVPNEESYPGHLERRLNARAAGTGTRFEVLNFGVGGYATRDEVAALEGKALALDPDLVIIDFHPNGPESDPVQPLHQVFRTPEWWEHSNVLRLLAYGKRQWGVWTLGGGHEYRYLASPAGPHWPTLLAAYDKARTLCDARGLRVVIAIFPTLGERKLWSEYPYHDIHAQVREAAEARGFVPVDILPVYERSGHDVPTIAADAEHPNSLGLDLAAGELERVIVERFEELLGRPAPWSAAAPPR
jgi:hypothetical protein